MITNGIYWIGEKGDVRLKELTAGTPLKSPIWDLGSETKFPTLGSGVTVLEGTEYPARMFANRIKVICREAGLGGTSVKVTLKTSSSKTSAGALDNATAIYEKTIPLAALIQGEVLVNTEVDYMTKRYIQCEISVVGTFTAGVVFGEVTPIVSK